MKAGALTLALACALGAPVGVGAFTFIYANRHYALLQRAAKATTDMLDAIVTAKKAGATEAALRDAAALHRKAQWRLDFVAAENSMGFHAPQELARILGEAIDYAPPGAARRRSDGEEIAATRGLVRTAGLPDERHQAPGRYVSRAGDLAASAIREFLRLQSAGGILLMLATVVALGPRQHPRRGTLPGVPRDAGRGPDRRAHARQAPASCGSTTA